MNKRGIGSFNVVEKGKPAGIVTERDMLRRILLGDKDPKRPKLAR